MADGGRRRRSPAEGMYRRAKPKDHIFIRKPSFFLAMIFAAISSLYLIADVFVHQTGGRVDFTSKNVLLSLITIMGIVYTISQFVVFLRASVMPAAKENQALFNIIGQKKFLHRLWQASTLVCCAAVVSKIYDTPNLTVAVLMVISVALAYESRQIFARLKKERYGESAADVKEVARYLYTTSIRPDGHNGPRSGKKTKLPSTLNGGERLPKPIIGPA